MKNLLLFLAFSFFSLTPFVVFAQGNCSIKLIAPNGGEVLKNGQVYKIRWEQENISGGSIMAGGSSVGNFTSNPASKVGEFDWQTSPRPDIGQNIDQFKVSIHGWSPDGACAANSESADYFIMNKEGDGGSLVKLIDSSSGLGVDKQRISWQQKRIDSVSIYYAPKIVNQSGYEYKPIIENLPQKTGIGGDWMGRYEWNISSLSPNYYSIKILGFLNGKKTAEDVSSEPRWLVNEVAYKTFSVRSEVTEITNHSAKINCDITGASGKRYIDYGVTTQYGLTKETDCRDYLDGLKPATTYHYKIRQGSGQSDDATFTTSRLAAPGNLIYQILKKDTVNSQIRLYWDDNKNTTKVYLCVSYDCVQNSLVASVNGNHYDTEVSSDEKKYSYFKIKSLSGNEESGFGGILVVNMRSVEKPVTVRSKVVGTKAEISWDSKMYATSYANSGLVYSKDKACLDFGTCGKVISNEVLGFYYSKAEISNVTGTVYYRIFANGSMFDEIRSVVINGSTPSSGNSNKAKGDNESSIIVKSGQSLDAILKHAGKKKDTNAQIVAMKKFTEPIAKGQKILLAQKYALNNFIVYGTASTKKLNQDKRTSAIKKFIASFKKVPKSESDWNEVLKICKTIK